MAQNDLTSKFPGMTPVKSPPALFRLNGCGVGMYGKRDHDAQTNTHVATWCLSVLFVPCFCLRAYRVAPAPRGWYFVGREPLSGLAKGWNALVIAAILVAIGVVQFDRYTASPAYKAKRQMSAAHSLVEGGHLAQGAKVYQALAIAGADQSENATSSVKDLLDNQCQQAPLSESASVFASAAQVARRGNALPISDVADKGVKLVTAKGDADPRGGIAMLDVIRPLVMDTRPIDARRLALLRKWAVMEPGNLDVLIPLASLLEQQGKLDEAKNLLLPFKSQLGDGAGARVLGTILGREGDYDGSYALLWPYVKSRLDSLHGAEQASEDALKQLWDREIKLLDDKQAPQEFYDKYTNASKDEQRTMVREYVNGRIKDDPQYVSSQETLERETAVVPVALELGMVMLQRAQGQPKPDVRKAQLESAEQVFLAIGGVAGQTPTYRISLGQVYYWLGKQAEGHKLFDDFLTANGRTFSDLSQIATKLRLLGAIPEARTLAEEAYGKASKPEEQHQIAGFRALCSKDSDDEIEWLNKSDLAEPWVKADLAKTLGDKAFQAGQDDEAGRQYHNAVDAYSAMPRTATTVNQSALAYYAIFAATGDRQSLDHCYDLFQQAVELQPGNPILLYNAGTTLLQGAMSDLIGNDIDLRAIHETGDIHLLGLLYKDQASRDALVQRVKDHPGIARALSYLQKVTVLSPKDSKAFSDIYGTLRFTQNVPALHDLESRIRAADLDNSDQLANVKEFLNGSKAQQNQVALTASIKRGDDICNTARAKGGRTAAAALCRQIEQMLLLDMNSGAVAPDKVVALAEEAERVSSSANTGGLLVVAHLFRASKNLRQSDPDFDAFCVKYGRLLSVADLMAVAASEPSSFQQKVVEHPDVQEAMKLVRDEDRLFPGRHSTYEWALLKSADAATAEKYAQDIRNDPRQEVDQAIASLLSPAACTEAVETYWLMQIEGKADEGRSALRKLADQGIPVPIQP